MSFVRSCLTFLALIAALCASANAASPSASNATAVVATQSFVSQALTPWGSRATFTVEGPAPGIQFAPCARHEVFLPAESRLWGKTRVGIKCSTPSAWIAYLPVTVTITGQYLLVAKKINRGQNITESDLEQRQGDLTQLPDTVLNDMQQAIGQRSKVSLAAGLPLRRDHLILPPVIKQGDKVRILVRGSAFSVASDGVALHDAAEGEPIKVRNSAGKTLSGIARAAGEVELIP